MTNGVRTNVQGKIIQTDYDLVMSMTGECEVCLTNAQIQMILSVIDYWNWPTRWYSPIEQPIVRNDIETIAADLARRLMMACCGDVPGRIYRFTSEGIYQYSDDDGTTWVDDPENDPREAATRAPLIPGEDGDGKKCAASDNIAAMFTGWRDQLEVLLEGGTFLSAIIAALIGFIATVLSLSVVGTAWGVLLFGLAAALLSAGAEGVSDEITDEKIEEFKCLLYCRVEADGSFTPSGVQGLLEDIAGQFSGLAETFFYQTVASMGYIGLTNAGTAGSATSDDCGDCGCDDCHICTEEGRVTTGTFVSCGVNEDGKPQMVVDSAEIILGGNVFQAVQLGTYGEAAPPGVCCDCFGWGVVSGATPTSYGYTQCNGTVVDPGNPETHVWSSAYWTSGIGGAPFRISITFEV